MHCPEFRKQAEQWMEGERSSAAAAHLETCARCRALVEDLVEIRATAVHLREAEPPERVWIALRNQLAAEGLIQETVEAAEPARSWLWFLPALPRPALAAVYVALLLVVSGLLIYRVGGPTPGSDLAVMPVFSVPSPRIQERLPEVSASYQKNLEIVDNFIVLCKKTVRENPKNEEAREYLYSAYQQKAELLAQLTERGARGD
jgi:hypothetical protein